MSEHNTVRYNPLIDDRRREIEREVFDGSGQALTRLRKVSRNYGYSPVAFLIQTIQWVLSAMPAGCILDAGRGPISLNLFSVVYGVPGGGKDSLANDIADLVTIDGAGTEIKPVEGFLGSGEGVLEQLHNQDSNPAPILFRESEVTQLGTYLDRRDSSLRSVLLKMFSGNPLGNSTKQEKIKVARNRYTAGVWVAVQPEKAYVILGGNDDGLRHRFVWVDCVDADALELPPRKGSLHPVMIPQEVLKGRPIGFPAIAREETLKARYRAVRYGESTGTSGHRNLIRARLAAGLALLQGNRSVSEANWRRAGVLMDYSDSVRDYAALVIANHEVERKAQRAAVEDDAAARVHERRTEKLRATIFKAVHASGERGVMWSQATQNLNSNTRGKHVADGLLEQLAAGGVVYTDSSSGKRMLVPGPNFDAAFAAEADAG
ncbi:hypothetical protein ACPV6E_06100 [Corynebacterium propinquum]|uniref:hypothetical protein n=1 Tax=Corynebacterium propinquum TaxID=43769 RepID=UPI003CB10CE5